MLEALPAEPRRAALSLPSCLFSICFHAVLIVVLGLTIQAQPPAPPGEEPSREVGVVLKQLDRSGETHYRGDESEAASNPAASPSPRQLVGDQPPVDIASALPKSKEIIAIGGLPGEGASSARQMTGDRAPTPNFRAGMARTKIYGLSGQGFKFVYCFDHSASMGGSGNNALRAAKIELLASLGNLGPTHQFQIIFYNDHPTIFDIAGSPGRLVYANPQNKQQAEHFIEGMKAGGGTDHEAALDMALNLNPDVIFFLTDADQPSMTTSQLARVRRRNHGAAINTIEFGLGPSLGDENFLMRLAQQNGGAYTYIDLTKSLGDG
ncbi:MAG TPA: VWA domain-containing protein [Pirellulales bacterium]|nr:VWA domain-containing protein [Pirellulales bacterium]